MRVWEALTQTHVDVKNILVGAGLIDGSLLTVEAIARETGVMFWHIVLTSKDASEKPTYVVYNIIECPVVQHYGRESDRKSVISVDIYSRSSNTLNLLSVIDEAFFAAGWYLEYDGTRYDNGNKMYIMSFVCSKSLL